MDVAIGDEPSAKKYFSKPENISSEKKQAIHSRVNQYLDSIKENQVALKASDILKSTLACAAESFLSIPSCNKSLEVIKEKMTPKGASNDITDKELWRRVLGSDKYNEGLRETALIIADKVVAKEPASNNVFDDLQAGFLKAGLTSAEAIEASWDILGFVGNHGPNSGSYASKVENGEKDYVTIRSMKSRAISYISSAMTYLDYKNLKSGSPMYSYPRNVKSKCDNSKPYHFWMSAYLSRSLVKEHGISPRDAANATFIAEKAYQINRNVAGDGNQVKNTIFTSALFSPVHQIVRTDLAYAAAGAHYGSRSVDSTSSKEYDVNGAIVNLMKNAGTESVIAGESNGDQIATYFSWNKIFSPNAALSYLK